MGQIANRTLIEAIIKLKDKWKDKKAQKNHTHKEKTSRSDMK